MTRTITCIAVALFAISVAHADDKAQLAAAKKAFEDAKALYDSGKRAEAIDKLKESYRLSHNVFLLYNIGHAYDQLDQQDKALAYYLEFLKSAPATATMIDEVKKRVAELQGHHVQADVSSLSDSAPTKTYAPTDFHHTPIESVPPGQPFDITATVPQDSGFSVTLFYRGQNDAEFASQPLTWRDQELVARIPGTKVEGSSLQYYLEVRDKAGNVVTRSGKSTSPNLVNIEASARSHFDAGLSDEGFASHDHEDPLRTNPLQTGAAAPRDTSRYGTAKWVSTGVAGALLGGAVTMYFVARQHSNTLRNDANSCGTPPCRVFDAKYDQHVEADGLRDNTIYQVSLGLGIAAVGVAGYFWYRNLTSHEHAGSATQVMITPAIGDGFAGASAAARF